MPQASAAQPVPEGHRAGFVNIVGSPNVGKSTLMNRLVGERLSIINAKAQTTRHRIMGIVNEDDYQIVYSDTPGVLEKGGDGLYRNASNVQPVEANDVQIHQGSLEASNVNPLMEITNLIEISRAYESITRMIENTNDLSRRAVERLGKAA